MPVYSGRSLEYIESDPTQQQVIETLVDQTKASPGQAVWFLMDVISKVEAMEVCTVFLTLSQPHQRAKYFHIQGKADELTIIQSRLYLLKVVYYLLSNRVSAPSIVNASNSQQTPISPSTSSVQSPRAHFHPSVTGGGTNPNIGNLNKKTSTASGGSYYEAGAFYFPS